jgi:hypothetical protein
MASSTWEAADYLSRPLECAAVGDDRLDAAQAAAGELVQERGPERSGFGGADVHADRLGRRRPRQSPRPRRCGQTSWRPPLYSALSWSSAATSYVSIVDRQLTAPIAVDIAPARTYGRAKRVPARRDMIGRKMLVLRRSKVALRLSRSATGW